MRVASTCMYIGATTVLTEAAYEETAVRTIDVINVEMKIKKTLKNVKKRGENKKETFVNVG